MAEPDERGRGREAERPAEIPKKGWKDIAVRVYRGLSREDASVEASGVAFFAFLSVPAILTTLVSIYGLAANPGDVAAQMSSIQGVIPKQALPVIAQELRDVSSHSSGSLTLALVISSVFALYSASSSTKALLSALNAMYEETEKRGFFKYNAVSLVLTLGGIVLAALSVALVVGITALIDRVNAPPALKDLVAFVRWPILAGFITLSLAVIYRFGPSRENPRWRWVSWGAVIATALFLATSALFSWYAGQFGSYNKTYGSLSAVVVLLMWFYITAYVVLLGAKVNAEMEHQTDRDSTTGEPLPMGKRGAKMADTRGEAA